MNLARVKRLLAAIGYAHVHGDQASLCNLLCPYTHCGGRPRLQSRQLATYKPFRCQNTCYKEHNSLTPSCYGFSVGPKPLRGRANFRRDMKRDEPPPLYRSWLLTKRHYGRYFWKSARELYAVRSSPNIYAGCAHLRELRHNPQSRKRRYLGQASIIDNEANSCVHSKEQ